MGCGAARICIIPQPGVGRYDVELLKGVGSLEPHSGSEVPMTVEASRYTFLSWDPSAFYLLPWARGVVLQLVGIPFASIFHLGLDFCGWGDTAVGWGKPMQRDD